MEKKLKSVEVNHELLDSEILNEIEAMTTMAFKNAYSLPSVGDKSGSETYRLFFKRRHTVERTNLIVIRASNLLIATGYDFIANGQERV